MKKYQDTKLKFKDERIFTILLPLQLTGCMEAVVLMMALVNFLCYSVSAQCFYQIQGETYVKWYAASLSALATRVHVQESGIGAVWIHSKNEGPHLPQ